MSKTLLTPERQWRLSVCLAHEWLRAVRPAIAKLAAVYEIGNLKFEDHCRAKQSLYENVRNEYFASSRRSNLFGDFEYLAAHHNDAWTFGATWIPGIASWTNRHLVKDDLVLVGFWNGTERQPVWCVSSKGHRLCGYYCDTNRLGARGTIIRLLDVPDELVGRQLSDPDAEKYCLSLRAGTSASG